MLNRRALLIAALAASCASAQALAQSAWPNRPVRWIVAGTPGSPIDAPARVLAERLQEQLGQPFVVENQPSAGGTVAAGNVARAAPDGYTFLVGFNGPLAYAPFLYSRLPYDPLKDLAPVVRISGQPYVLAVSAGLGVKTFADFVQKAKEKPGAMTYASLGNGTGTHVAMEMLKKRVGLDLTHVPFGHNAGLSVIAVANGEVQAMLAPLGMAMPLARSGKVTVIAQTSAQRFPLVPDVPTLIESGVADFATDGWIGLVAPAGTPVDIVTRLNRAINDLLRDEAVRAKFAAALVQPAGGSAEQFGAFLRQEARTWEPVIRATGVKLD